MKIYISLPISGRKMDEVRNESEKANAAIEVIEHFEWIVDGDKCYCYDCQEWDGETKSYKTKKGE